MDRFKVLPSPVLPRKEGQVTFPVSYKYNGGVVVEGQWFEGFEVGLPVIPAGYELVSLAMGLQLNAKPPLATMYLKKIAS